MLRRRGVDGCIERVCLVYLKGGDFFIGPVGELKITRCAVENVWVGRWMRRRVSVERSCVSGWESV